MESKVIVGARVRFTHPTSNGGRVTYTAQVVRVTDGIAVVCVPARVRSMPFAPGGGAKFLRYRIESLESAVVAQ